MVVTLPNEMDDWVSARARSEGFDDADAFILNLVQRERAFEDAITLGEASGVSPRSFDEIVADARSKFGHSRMDPARHLPRGRRT